MRPMGVAVVVLVSLLSAGAWAQQAPPRVETKNPHGSSVGECGLCHQAEAWSPARISPKFDHGKSGFPLAGTHAKTPCRACHTSLDFTQAKPARECVSCHQDVHLGELGDDCVHCHTPRSFLDRARMARGHQVTRFPLTGSHLMADCEGCHPPAVQGRLSYVNLPTECVACHLSDYQATTSPDHETTGFPQDCQQCHTPTTWPGAKFVNHDPFYFPIFSGKHKGKWTACSDCHINPSNQAEFSCLLGCHAHSNQADLTGKHSGISGFVYDSTACYGCHPDGRKP